MTGNESCKPKLSAEEVALVLRKELQDRWEACGLNFEWAEMLRDLLALQTVEVDHGGKRFLLRSEAEGSCSREFHAVGVALPPTIQAVTGER